MNTECQIADCLLTAAFTVAANDQLTLLSVSATECDTCRDSQLLPSRSTVATPNAPTEVSTALSGSTPEDISDDSLSTPTIALGGSLLTVLIDGKTKSMLPLLAKLPGEYHWKAIFHPGYRQVMVRAIVMPGAMHQGFPIYQLNLTELDEQTQTFCPGKVLAPSILAGADLAGAEGAPIDNGATNASVPFRCPNLPDTPNTSHSAGMSDLSKSISNGNSQCTFNILPGMVVYVISQNHRILYANESVHDHFPQARVGMVCHELFMGRTTPCEGCVCLPCRDADHPEIQTFSTIWPFSPFSFPGAVRISASRVLWENREEACIICVSAHVRSKEEADLLQKKNSYIHALCDTYDYVLDINAETDVYDLLALRESDDILHPIGQYSELIHNYIEHRVHPDNIEAFRTRFSLDYMTQEFKNGATSVSMQYRWQKQGEPLRWKTWLALPYLLIPGSVRILAYVQDITDQKTREDHQRDEASQYLVALQNIYAEMFRIDVPTMFITPLYYNSEQVPMDSETTPLGPFMNKRATNRLHPDSEEVVDYLFDPDRIREQMRRGETFEAEYRKRQTEDSEYRWINTLLHPVPGNPDAALVLMRDVTSTRQDKDNYLQALQSSYTEIFHLNLRDGSLAPLYYNCDEVSIATGSVNIDVFVNERSRDRLHPDFVQLYRDFFTLENVREAVDRAEVVHAEYQKYDSITLQYRWISATLRPVPGDRQSVLLLVRDITEQKQKEEERLRDAQRFALALRGVYCEVYEMDVDTERSSLLFSSDANLVPIGMPGLDGTAEIITTVLHPEDQARAAASFAGKALRQSFEAGIAEVTEDYRRLGYDGAYHWVSAIVVPLWDGSIFSGQVMLLVKDIAARKEAELRQRVSDQYFLALRNIYDLLFEFNATQNTYQCVHRGVHGYAQPPEHGALDDLITLTASSLIHPDERHELLRFLDLPTMRAHVGNKDTPYSHEFRTLRDDGEYQWSTITILGVPAQDQVEREDEIYIVFFMDIHARKIAEDLQHQNSILERQRLDDERYRIIVEQTNTLVFEWDTKEVTRYQSPDLEHRFAGKYDHRDLLQVWHDDAVIHPGDMALFNTFMQDCAEADHSEMTVRLLRRAGGYIWCKVVLTKLLGADRELSRAIGTINDVDEATRSVAALQYRAEYDPLTGILNTATFYARSERLLHEHNDRTWYIVRMDIDRFKVINDLYGLGEGDLLLKKIARMLDVRVKKHGVCSRISGDVFCACVDFDRKTIIDMVHDITDELKHYPLASSIVPSFGICEVDFSSTPINVLCDWANLALKTVKGNVMVSYAFYDGKLRAHILEEKRIETEMRDALARGDFLIYLQPKVHIASGRIVGAEALVRWNHPVDGIIAPDFFIPLFERNGFIINLDEYVWDLACATLRRWIDRGLKPVPVSINVSRLHIHDLRLTEKLLNLVAKYQLPPSLLELELTESLFFDNETQMLDTIITLQGHGFNFSLDDFGAGYSSLNMLKSMPIEIIKIDRAFLSEVSASERGQTVVRHTIALAQAMNMNVVAEGVETIEQAQFLLDAQCELAQGYFYSPPVPVPAFEALTFGTNGNDPIHFPCLGVECQG